MKQRVLITQTIPEIALNRLSEFFEITYHNDKQPLSEADLIRSAKGHFGILCFLSDKISSNVIQSLPGLKIIANYAVGTNNIDLEAAAKNSVLVSNTPDVLTNASADLALALLLSVGRRIIESDRFCREGKFTGWESTLFLGYEFSGKKCGIIGMGRIGSAFARRAEALGMEIFYFNRNIVDGSNARYCLLDNLLSTCHVVSLHLPLTASTRQILDTRKLNLLRNDAILINTGRGELIDENALAQMLKSNRIYGAGLDVFEREPHIHPDLLQLNNVVLTPHIGSATTETRNNMALLAANSIIAAYHSIPFGNQVK